MTTAQQAWIDGRVGSGAFDSVQDAVTQLLDERIAEESLSDDNEPHWAKPLAG
jgi:hypothetical protein